MKYFIVFFILTGFLGYSQTKIDLQKNPYSDEKHSIVLLRAPSVTNHKAYYDIKDQDEKYAWKNLHIDIVDFKSLIIDNKSITIQLDADGIAKLDEFTTDYEDKTIAFIYNDTIYQTQEVKAPILNGQFRVSNLTKKQKNKIINYYKSLPPYALQKKLYSAIHSHKISKIDSLLNEGAQLIDGGYKVGPNNFKNVIYNLFRSKNSKYEKYSKTVKHLLKRGFIAKPKNIKQAIVFEDVEYVKNFFLKEKNLEKRSKLLKKYVSDIIDYSSLELLKLVEDLGLNLETVTFGKKTLLMKAILDTGDPMIVDYLLTKNIAYDSASILVYATIYNKIETLDALLNRDVNINALFEDNSNIAQSLIVLEFKHDYFMDNVSLEKIPKLIERGLNLKTSNKKEQTILHTLAIYVKGYLGYRSGVYSTYDPDDVSKDIIDLVTLIKSKGVDTKIKDSDGFTAYDYVLKDMKAFKIKPEATQEVLNAFK